MYCLQTSLLSQFLNFCEADSELLFYCCVDNPSWLIVYLFILSSFPYTVITSFYFCHFFHLSTIFSVTIDFLMSFFIHFYNRCCSLQYTLFYCFHHAFILPVHHFHLFSDSRSLQKTWILRLFPSMPPTSW